MRNVKLLFDNTFDENIQKVILKAVFQSYLSTQKLVNEQFQFNVPTAKDVIPYLRKTQIDYYLSLLPKLNNRFSVEFKPNSARNCGYLELSIDKFVITQNHVESRYQHPRDSKFRTSLKGLNPQRYLFKYNDETNSVEYLPNNDLVTDVCYVQLLHGSIKELPDFVTIGIPSSFQGEWITVQQIPHELYFEEGFEKVPDLSHPKFIEKIKENNNEQGNKE